MLNGIIAGSKPEAIVILSVDPLKLRAIVHSHTIELTRPLVSATLFIMVPPADLAGRRFGRLLVIKRSLEPSKNLRWICKCDCGQVTDVRGDALKAKNPTVSCGCYGRERQLAAVRANITHGMSKTRVYYSWHCMMTRCYSHSDKRWYMYGARGIKVCVRWHRFENFLADMGEPPLGKSLDRINGNEGYSPANCRWADIYVQRRNRVTNKHPNRPTRKPRIVAIPMPAPMSNPRR